MKKFGDNEEKSRRLFRVEEQIKRVISELLIGGIKDPRIGLVGIGRVEVTPDLREARVYVRPLGETAEMEETMEGLRSARGYIQRELGRQLRIKYTPVIRFFPDRSAERAGRIDRLIEKIKEEEKKKEENGEHPRKSD